MSELPEELRRECEVFARHLGVARPDPSVVDAYLRAHAEQPERYAAQGFDRTLVSFAGRGPLAARAADLWARLRRPKGALRRKLVLCLALLETTAAGSAALDEPEDVGLARLLLEALAVVLGAATALLIALLLLAPRELLGGSAR